MSEFIGKVCPYCKTEIKEGESIKVCPGCGIPHHDGCWEENKGCTTFGCSEQHYETQGTNPTDVCSNCGATLGDGQEFCYKCGTPKSGNKKKICGKCGAELQEGQEFCPKCGQKVGLSVDAGVSSAISQFNEQINKSNDAKKKKPIKIISIVAVIIAVVLAVVLLAPKIFVSVEDLCAQGNYVEAYEKANDDEKSDVEAANAVAFCSALCVDSLKDSKSFELREAWYDPSTYGITLKVAANNSYGNTVINYWYYSWGKEDEEYSLLASVSSLEDETSYSWDDSSEKIEKLLNNAARLLMRKMMVSKYKISSDNVDNINNLFESDLLNDVKLIDITRV